MGSAAHAQLTGTPCPATSAVTSFLDFLRGAMPAYSDTSTSKCENDVKIVAIACDGRDGSFSLLSRQF